MLSSLQLQNHIRLKTIVILKYTDQSQTYSSPRVYNFFQYSLFIPSKQTASSLLTKYTLLFSISIISIPVFKLYLFSKINSHTVFLFILSSNCLQPCPLFFLKSRKISRTKLLLQYRKITSLIRQS